MLAALGDNAGCKKRQAAHRTSASCADPHARTRHARPRSRLASAQSGVDLAALKAARTPINLAHPAEWAFGVCVIRMQDKLEEVLRDLQPHVICEFLYDTCVKLNSFVFECRVIQVEESPSRLMLCAAGLQVMRTCFDLLGIQWLERI
jgi:arginyl-tRNA synthetase